MKAPAALLADIRRRLERTWAATLTGDDPAWPHRFPLGAVKKTDLEPAWRDTYQPLIRQWRDWAQAHPATLHTTPKRVYSTTQDIPTHVTIEDLHTAAELVQDGWPEKLATATMRQQRLRDRFPDAANSARTLRSVTAYDVVDFDLLLTVADWFTANSADGLTPRQVPIPGVHAKWLNTHQSDILALTGKDTLGLLPRHPARIHFTYLDPSHRKSGGRIHDSATVGDQFQPAYQPRVVVISENKDTAIHFPELPGAIAVEGVGKGGRTAASFPWIVRAPNLYYWGDMDADGYEILDGFRDAGIPAASILMDPDTYRVYEPFGTNQYPDGRPVPAGPRKNLERLTDEERAVYERLTDPEWSGHRRVEQERIPLHRAVQRIEEHAT